MAPLNLPVGPAGIAVSVQPAVLLNICDAYIRRNDGQARVIGTLLGAITDGVVDIRNCYAVPHNETNDQARPGSRSFAFCAPHLSTHCHFCATKRCSSASSLSAKQACNRPFSYSSA